MIPLARCLPVVVLPLLAVASSALALPEAPRWHDGKTGASRYFYNSGAKLPWATRMGDWRDRGGVTNGNDAWARAAVVRSGQWQVDVTELVAAMASGAEGDYGFFLRLLRGSHTVKFRSRESAEANAPRLVVTTAAGEQVLPVRFDTTLDPSTYKALGRSKTITVASDKNLLLWFDLSVLPAGAELRSAQLQLQVSKVFGSGSGQIGVFATYPGAGRGEASTVSTGLAAQYPGDEGIADAPGVWFQAGFDSLPGGLKWSTGKTTGGAVQDPADTSNGFLALCGPALRAVLGAGKQAGLNRRLRFASNGVQEPTEAYFRYYLRLGDDWNQTASDGKMPGFAGTYGVSGWGGRKATGEDGWSARGSYYRTVQTLPGSGTRVTPIGNYVYHLDQKGPFGSLWPWNHGKPALLLNNRWYAVEQHVKLNTPGQADGRLRAWVDGHLVLEKSGLRFRSSDKLKIQEVWLNWYHGGTKPSPARQSLYIDNLVVADRYIGPMTPGGACQTPP